MVLVVRMIVFVFVVVYFDVSQETGARDCWDSTKNKFPASDGLDKKQIAKLAVFRRL